MNRAPTNIPMHSIRAGALTRWWPWRPAWGALSAVAGATMVACAAESPNASGGALAKDQAVLHTSKGDIVIEFYPQRAPLTVKNFRRYLSEGFYDGTVFHRVIPGFVIQGGGFAADMTQKSNHAPIRNEASNGLRNERGALSMARTNDPHSATSQFFINLTDNASLDPSGRNAGYAVFAKVVSGMEVVDLIAKEPTGSRHGHGDVPIEPIMIERATLR